MVCLGLQPVAILLAKAANRRSFVVSVDAFYSKNPSSDTIAINLDIFHSNVCWKNEKRQKEAASGVDKCEQSMTSSPHF